MDRIDQAGLGVDMSRINSHVGALDHVDDLEVAASRGTCTLREVDHPRQTGILMCRYHLHSSTKSRSSNG